MSSTPSDEVVPLSERPTVRMHRVRAPDACPVCHGRGVVPPEIATALEKLLREAEERK